MCGWCSAAAIRASRTVRSCASATSTTGRSGAPAPAPPHGRAARYSAAEHRPGSRTTQYPSVDLSGGSLAARREHPQARIADSTITRTDRRVGVVGSPPAANACMPSLPAAACEPTAVCAPDPPFKQSWDTAGGDRQASRHGVVSPGYVVIRRTPERLKVDPDRPIQRWFWCGGSRRPRLVRHGFPSSGRDWWGRGKRPREWLGQSARFRSARSCSLTLSTFHLCSPPGVVKSGVIFPSA
jgi:hypothetical protein